MTGVSVELSRRGLLGAAAAGLVVLSASQRRAFAQSSYDLIIVGAGTAGMPAAIFAAQAGGKVLLIEKGAKVGGTLDRAVGQIAGAGTRLQARLGIEDTPQMHYDDVMRISKGTTDPDLVRVFTENGAATLDWLEDNGLVPLDGHPILGDGHEPYTTRRYLWGAENGVSLIKAMEPSLSAHVYSGQVDLMTRTAATELIFERGDVAGVVVETAAGQKLDMKGRAVLLAAGGCGSNPAMYEDLHGVPMYLRLAHPHAQGDGITMGLSAGGYVRGADRYTATFGSLLADANFPAPPGGFVQRSPGARQPWEVFVNMNGERFVAEDHESVDVREQALTKQPGQRYWIVFDQTILDTAPPITPSWSKEQFMAQLYKHPFLFTGDTLQDVADAAGISATGLTETVDAYNIAQASGKDPLGRVHMPLPIGSGPYYAIQMQGSTVVSFAGLAINDQFNVVTDEGLAIPNLFAAGEVIGGGATSGQAYTNGMMITPAITFGRMIGSRLGAA